MNRIATHFTHARRTPSSHGIVQPGKNCWRVDRADRFRCVQDAADYFRLVRQALLRARETVFILGWDILASVDLEPAGANGSSIPLESAQDDAAAAPTTLGDLLAFIAQRRPELHCYVLIWDYAALYALERDPFSRVRLGWNTPAHVRFAFDDCHPIGGSHHQKIVVVDDRLAFCGGIDLTGHRWDTSAHRPEEPARTSPLGGDQYGPYHEVQAMMTGPIAAALGVLARDRWRVFGEEAMPPVQPATADLWPRNLAPDLTDVDVAIARTIPASETRTAVLECEQLFLDSIARAQRGIYIESQYFTNDRLCDALARRLREPNGPEVLIVSPKSCDGWLEHNTMGAFRDSVFRRLIAADTHHRLRLVYPTASRERDVPTFVHSKVMVVDDELVRIGSANVSRRSMRVDTECDVAVDARGDARIRAGIRRIRDRLLGEHLALSAEDVARGIDQAGSMCAFVDTPGGADHTLVPLELETTGDSLPSPALRAAADPDEPILSAPPTSSRGIMTRLWHRLASVVRGRLASRPISLAP